MVNLKSLIQSKEGRGEADVSIQQKAPHRVGIQSIDGTHPHTSPQSPSHLNKPQEHPGVSQHCWERITT